MVLAAMRGEVLVEARARDDREVVIATASARQTK
jgi:hypothetical protein